MHILQLESDRRVISSVNIAVLIQLSRLQLIFSSFVEKIFREPEPGKISVFMEDKKEKEEFLNNISNILILTINYNILNFKVSQ